MGVDDSTEDQAGEGGVPKRNRRYQEEKDQWGLESRNVLLELSRK